MYCAILYQELPVCSKNAEKILSKRRRRECSQVILLKNGLFETAMVKCARQRAKDPNKGTFMMIRQS